MLAEAQHFDMLAAMGIDVYLLRTRDTAAVGDGDRADATASAASVGAISASPALVVACARGASADAHTGHLRGALPLALGVAAARIVWIEPDAAGVLATAPAANAYLALGADMARALGEQLSTMRQMSAVIAVADAPRACLSNSLARRALWQALKPVARQLQGRAG